MASFLSKPVFLCQLSTQEVCSCSIKLSNNRRLVGKMYSLDASLTEDFCILCQATVTAGVSLLPAVLITESLGEAATILLTVDASQTGCLLSQPSH